MKAPSYRSLLLGLLLATASFQALAQSGGSGARRELIYCADLMSHEEREAYRTRMRAAQTVEEKESLRAAHRSDMQARARKAGREGQCEPLGRQWRGGRDK